MKKFCLLFLVVFSLNASSFPTLTEKDVQQKINEMLNLHVTYKSLSSDLIGKVLVNFIEEIDPLKTYFIKEDIEKWLHPKEDFLNQLILQVKASDFQSFDKIIDQMHKAIVRRNELEKTIETHPQTEKPQTTDFQWVESQNELIERLRQIKSLQLEAAQKLNDEPIEFFFQRLQKRRLHKEEEFKLKENKNLVLTYFLKAFSSALDSHTTYFTPQEAKEFLIQVQQRMFGIGVQLKDNLNGFKIVRIVEKGPADKEKKLRLNDIIIAVNKEPVAGMDIVDAVELIRGEKGSKVLLTLLRTDSESEKTEKIDIEASRGEVVLEEARIETSYEPYGDGVIGHVKLFCFYQDPHTSSTLDLKKAIEDLKSQHRLKGLVLDLRNNSGGLLPQAVAVTGLFITKGIVVSIKDNQHQLQHLRDTSGKVTYDGPLIVLVNRASASAAEIVAQTLQDYGRALVVGDDHTFGKGTFQTFTLENGMNPKISPKGEYKITRGIYYTVSGKSPQLIGVQSDIQIPGIFSEFEIGEKFAKFPLPNDQISAHFDDDLSDIPPVHRKKVNLLYKYHLQPVLTTYTKYLSHLKSNSEKRLELNKSYQNFLQEIKNKHFESADFFHQTDLQLFETLNVMKDLIFMMEMNEKYAAI